MRYTVILCLCIVGLSNNLKAQLSDEYVEYKWVADSLYGKENYAAAVGFFRKICDLPSFIPRYDYYYAAYCYTKINKLDSALLYLAKGAKKGMRFNKIRDIDSDKTLVPLRKFKLWDTIRGLLYENIYEFDHDPSRNDSLRKVLLNIQKKDEGVRLHWPMDSTYHLLSKLQQDSINDEFKDNTKEDEIELKKIINKFGWPGLRMVGYDGETAAWIIAQNSYNDSTFQVFCYRKMMSAMLLNYDSQLSNLAFLQDRILLNRGEQQIYGTQFILYDKAVQGKNLAPSPIWDEKNVNKRRHAVQLQPLETYLAESEKYNSNKK